MIEEGIFALMLGNMKFNKTNSDCELPNTPSTSQIKDVLDRGGSYEDIDELFYPGERGRHKQRVANYPIPEGTGRDRWAFERKPGGGNKTDYYVGDILIGSIYDHWKNCGGRNGYYQTHDGEKFAHWGGPEGAETYLIERYWLYGNPPEKKQFLKDVWMKLRGML